MDQARAVSRFVIGMGGNLVVTHSLRSLKEELLWERMPPMVMNTEIQGYSHTGKHGHRNTGIQNYKDIEKQKC